MAQIWKEQFDRTRHQNKMDATIDYRDGINFVPKWIFFVRVCSFTFEFHTIEQISQCLDFYSRKTHPSSRVTIGAADHWEFQRWFERLPMYLMEETKRQKVVKALASAVEKFKAEELKKYDPINR